MSEACDDFWIISENIAVLDLLVTTLVLETTSVLDPG